MNDALHMPVLLAAVLAATAPRAGMTVVDATLGLGGHAARFLDAIGETGELIGFDADERNLALATARLGTHKNIRAVHANFRQMRDLIPAGTVDVVLMDLGISSQHLDDAARGFSFRHDAPLDMRLDASSGQTVADLIREKTADELADIFFHYGEIRSSRKLAQLIKDAGAIDTTTALRECIESAGMGRVLPQAFQALRIAVNDELAALTDGLAAAVALLKPGGRLAVISFHSLEDRIVKHFFRTQKGSTLRILTKKPIAPSPDEIAENPRSRSAKLRVAEKVEI